MPEGGDKVPPHIHTTLPSHCDWATAPHALILNLRLLLASCTQSPVEHTFRIYVSLLLDMLDTHKFVHF